MRTELKELLFHRTTFCGTYETTGYCGNHVPTILLKDIYYKNKKITDHVWMIKTRTMTNKHLKPGDIIQFSAVVRFYTRKDGSKDYALDCPRNIKKIHSVYQTKAKKKPKRRYL